MKTNHQWTRIDTNRPEDRWTCFNHKGRHNASAILCPCACTKGIPLGARASRPHDDGFPGARASRPHDDGFPGARASRPHDDGFPGARASRPHNAWHSLDHLPHLDQPGTAPWLSFGLADAVPAGRVAACGIALKLSGSQRDSMRAGRPRSRARLFPPTGWLPAASHGSSAAAKGTACGRDARAPGQGKNREHGLHLSSMHYSFPSWFFVDNSFFPFPTLGGSLSILFQPLRGYLFLSEARPRYFSPDGTRRMRGERLKEP